MIERLLLKLFSLRVFCFLTGSLVSFTAGGFRTYQAATLFIAVDNTPIQNLLFLRGAHPIRDFYIAEIRFELLRVRPGFHLYIYHISRDNCRMVLLIFGIHTSRSCGPSSSLDFVNFILDNLDDFSHVPKENPDEGKFYLQQLQRIYTIVELMLVSDYSEIWDCSGL
jgi:hypothetical protein